MFLSMQLPVILVNTIPQEDSFKIYLEFWTITMIAKCQENKSCRICIPSNSGEDENNYPH